MGRLGLRRLRKATPRRPLIRSPQPDHSWVTASGAVLDTAALIRSVVDVPHHPQADLRNRLPVTSLTPHRWLFPGIIQPRELSNDPISIAEEFDQACEARPAAGVPLKPDRDEAGSTLPAGG